MTSHTCKYFGKCGGCQTPNLSYADQLSMKMRKMISVMGRFCRVDEIVGMENPYHYRAKAQSMFVRVGNEMLCGLYQSSSGRVIPAKSCLLEDEMAQRIRRTAEKLARSFSLTVYNPKNGRGLLRHIMVRVSRATSQAMVVIVTGTSPFTRAKAFTEALCAACPEIVTVVQCVNDADIPLWMGERQTVLYGSGHMEEILLGRRFTVSAKSFLQVNPTQTEVLYRIALDAAGLTGYESVLDAYCGVGTLGILAAPMAARVTGVEISEDAVANARLNASMNSVTNASFMAGDAGRYMESLTRDKKKPDVP